MNDTFNRELTGPVRAAAVIVAAGRGQRAGIEGGPKQYHLLAGRSILQRTLDVFLGAQRFATVVAVIHPDDHGRFAETCPDAEGRVRLVDGGASRQESVRLGLLSLAEERPDIVLIHDAARPFVRPETIAAVLDATGRETGAIAAVPVADTLKRARADGAIDATIPRDKLFAAQTPQGFPFDRILRAHERAAAEGRNDFTDDAALAEWEGWPVRLVEGGVDNGKITVRRDIELAEQRLAAAFPDVRCGTGYDVHGFEPGDAVLLCGVRIAHEAKLAGHSDADVALHALADALLATCGAGDIGTHFPPSDPRWRGAPSRIFVEHAAKLVRAAGGRIANADVTVIAEAPQVGPHRAAMTAALSDMLGIAPGRISIKATTNERLGFVGRREGIAALASVSVVYPGVLAE